MTRKYSYNVNSHKNVWIDLDNSPHVPFFAPIITELGKYGYNIVISARNYSQTVQLADLYGFEFTPIGKHHGKNKILKIIGLIYRAFQLIPFAIKTKPHIAISHGSRAQMLVAHLLRIPIVLFLDYEFIQTIPFVRPSSVFLPNIISKNKIKSIGQKIVYYPGIKEDLYVPSFKPNSDILRHLSVNPDNIIVILRPPAHEAHYHNPEGEKLFTDIIEYLINIKNLQTILLPRDKRQKAQIEENYITPIKENKIIIPKDVFDGLNLIWHSDLVISGGGTMNREAAALGVPVYSIFKGKMGDVDKYLSESKKLVFINNIEDIHHKVKIERRDKRNYYKNINSLTLQVITDNLVHCIEQVFNPQEQTNVSPENDDQLFHQR